MSTFDNLSHNLRDTLGNISDGWQHLWQKARNSITYFAPSKENDQKDVIPATQSVRWGVLSADVKETDNNIEVQLESPGMSPDDFEIKIDHQALIVRGTKNYQSDRKEGRFHVTERAYGSFERLIPLPCLVDEDRATAKYKGGVLHVSLHKRQGAKVRRIPVA
ncbi:MAG: Hsp20/alpha crystallin family protein [bacterium]|nr:Hsp20/alpha crystallin family protein [Gammaproteobacteria bacterium]HIL95677.1 Hsp20/alpha crystallin family protein [Pseudomonadales bacterium]